MPKEIKVVDYDSLRPSRNPWTRFGEWIQELSDNTSVSIALISLGIVVVAAAVFFAAVYFAPFAAPLAAALSFVSLALPTAIGFTVGFGALGVILSALGLWNVTHKEVASEKYSYEAVPTSEIAPKMVAGNPLHAATHAQIKADAASSSQTVAEAATALTAAAPGSPPAGGAAVSSTVVADTVAASVVGTDASAGAGVSAGAGAGATVSANLSDAEPVKPLTRGKGRGGRGRGRGIPNSHHAQRNVALESGSEAAAGPAAGAALEIETGEGATAASVATRGMFAAIPPSAAPSPTATGNDSVDLPAAYSPTSNSGRISP